MNFFNVGKIRPPSGLGKHMRHAYFFVWEFPGWHTFNTRNRATVEAIRRLALRGLVDINQFSQFKRHI